MDFLKKIIQEKKKELKKFRKISLRHLLKDLKAQGERRDFKKAISKKGRLSIIAEIKRKSPSAGILIRDFKPVKLARDFEKLGVSALSVLTDKKFFGGDISILRKIRQKVKLPILRKDFIIDEYQVYESYLAGADVILLIVRILSLRKLEKLYLLAKKLNMDSIIEVHSRADLKKALKINPEIIGINNRDLKTFKVDLNTTRRLAPLIPKSKIIVSESGINLKDDLEFLRSKRVNAALIGEAFMKDKAF
ncbi:MAG: indole-3-glycerol phosphate synthase TrpC [Candidatus Omnitrophota bacterium]